MIENEKKPQNVHACRLLSRTQMEIEGVTDVPEFDEETVTLCTTCGNMEVTGHQLHIQVLNLEEGLVTLDGKIDGISYFDNTGEGKTGFFSGLFHRG